MGTGQQQARQPAAQTPSPTVAPAVGPDGATAGNQAAQDAAMGGGQADCDSDRLNDLFDAIAHKYTQILFEQARGVEELRQDASVEDPPPAWQSIAIAVGTIALAAATAGIGTAVAGSIAAATMYAAQSQAAATAAQAVVRSVIDNSLKTGITAGIQAMAPQATNVRDSFFRAQADALHGASADAQDAFNLRGRAEIRASADPCGAAQALFRALEAGRLAAKSEQRIRSLESWCTFMARGELGTSGTGEHEGTDLRRQVGDTSGKGVLGLEVTATSDMRSSVTVIDAEIEGLNETLRSELAGRPIASLRMPVTVHGQVDPPPWYMTRQGPSGILRIGRNEAGTLVDRSTPGGQRFLEGKGMGGPVMTGPGGLSASDRDAYRWQGIRKIIDVEIGRRSLRDVGVTLDG